MKTLEINIPDQMHERFELAAQKLGLTLEQFLQLTVEEKLDRLESNLLDATSYVLHKNEELYRRLAK